MKRKILAATTILVIAIALVSAAATLITAQPVMEGKVYTMDNAEANNVWQFDRMSDGSIMASGMFPTMGNGTGSQLDSQGALALSEDGNWLFVVNAGSDNITVFQVTDTGLVVTDVANSYGSMPVSVTVYDNWVYVLNAGTSNETSEPSPTPTATPTPTSTATPTPSPTATPSPTETPAASPTATPTQTPSTTITPPTTIIAETPTPSPSATSPSPTTTATPSASPPASENITAANMTSPNISGFTVDASGQLTYIEGSTQPLSGVADSAPVQIGFSPDGTALVVVEKDANMTDIYHVNEMGVAGAPMSMESVGDAPFGFAFTSAGFLVMSEAASNSMSSFAWTDNRSLRVISGVMPDFGEAACWVAISADDTYAYTTNAASGTISTYEISEMGHLNLVSSVAARVDSPALDLAFSSGIEGQYLYVLNGQNVTGFQVFADGGLWEVNSESGLPESVTGLVAV